MLESPDHHRAWATSSCVLRDSPPDPFPSAPSGCSILPSWPLRLSLSERPPCPEAFLQLSACLSMAPSTSAYMAPLLGLQAPALTLLLSSISLKPSILNVWRKQSNRRIQLIHLILPFLTCHLERVDVFHNLNKFTIQNQYSIGK